ncbi:uncharacterized protein LOC118517548 [Anopheles stephensi]|uniref:uncharacterized protein LOC118517548 n=1 Tax=Anopheles stephensi TaxID=30069 RepID=UPI0016589944|nr:uncharacterized protein LOC118517548 [Anopheles stephensi]
MGFHALCLPALPITRLASVGCRSWISFVPFPKVKAIIKMKLFLVSAFFFLASFQAARALRCMQGVEISLPSDDTTDKDKDKEKMPEYTECGIASTAVSAASLLVLKPSTATIPSTSYKCYHLRIETTDTKKASIVKGCIYKEQDVCDGKFKADSVREVFCSQCDQDECNSALHFASNWKMLGFTLFTIVCFFMK